MLLASALAALGLTLGLAHAPPKAASEQPDASQSPDVDEPDELPLDTAEPRDGAKKAFDAGLLAVEAGEFDAAVAAFERAFRLRPHPVALFNLALALEKAGRRAEAWELFEAALDIVESNTERQEIRRHIDALSAQIAILEIDATPRERLCIAGGDMPEGQVSDYRIALEPGRYAMQLDTRDFDIELAPGERRLLLLEGGSHSDDPPRRHLAPAMVGTALGAGALGLGLGIGAALVNDPKLRVGFAAGAAASAGVAMTASLIALLTRKRGARARTPKRETSCPGSPALDQRLDLQLLPNIERPARFSSAPPQLDGRLASSLLQAPLAPPASNLLHARDHSRGASALVVQNRPTTTSP